MEDIYTRIVELFENRRFSVLATMIRQTGAAPRHTGTKFLIMEDGSFVGTIGGGRLEAQVLEAADEVFKAKTPLRLNFVFRGKDVEKTEMLCGGDAEVFLEPLSPENPNQVKIFKEIMDTNRRGGSGVLATIVTQDRWQGGQNTKIFMASDGESIGSLGGVMGAEDALRALMSGVLEQGQPTVTTYHDREGKDLELFVEPLISVPVLYVFGGGHVSVQIVPFAARVGFRVVVIDDRPEFTNPVNFPEAAEVHQYPFEGVLDNLSVNESSYIVIVTRGHTHDKSVLAQSLKTPAKYIGMIGSRRKRNMVYEALLKEGFTKADLDRVYSPIGIDIGSETPEEIAVSIVAELIKVRAAA